MQQAKNQEADILSEFEENNHIYIVVLFVSAEAQFGPGTVPLQGHVDHC